MNKLNKKSEVYLVVKDNTMVIHYDCNRRCYNIKDVIVTATDEDDLHTLMTMKTDSINIANIETAIIDSLLINYKFISCSSLFSGFANLKRIIGLEYLNTSEVVSMRSMFAYCKSLISLDLSSFNISSVNGAITRMFNYCKNLETIYVGKGWDMSKVNKSLETFDGDKEQNFIEI